jgi:hypothetical protein
MRTMTKQNFECFLHDQAKELNSDKESTSVEKVKYFSYLMVIYMEATSLRQAAQSTLIQISLISKNEEVLKYLSELEKFSVEIKNQPIAFLSFEEWQNAGFSSTNFNI